MKTVSILMPCYNDGAYIKEAIASAQAQTWPSIEIIVVDDGSTDPETRKILAELKQQKRCTVLTQANQGPGAARNRAFQHAKGDYILPLDADDRIAPTYIEKALNELEAHPDAGVCYCHAELMGEGSGPWKLPDFSLGEMLIDNVIFVTALIRREAYAQVGGFDESLVRGIEDYDFFLSILEHHWQVRQLPETLFSYRIKSISRSRQLSEDDSLRAQLYQQIFDKHRDFFIAHLDQMLPAVRQRSFLYQANCMETQYLRHAIRDKSPKGFARLFLMRYFGKFSR